jgi:hypothetical protein
VKRYNGRKKELQNRRKIRKSKKESGKIKK